MKSYIIALLLFTLIIIPASAEDIYQAKIIMSGTQGTENNWVTEMWELNTSTSKTFMDVTVTFLETGINNQTGKFTVTGTGIISPYIVITEGADAICMRGKCYDNNNQTGNEKSIKIQVIDIKHIIKSTDETTTETTTTSDNPINVYADVNGNTKTLSSAEDNKFDTEQYLKNAAQDGWGQNQEVSKVNVFFKRRDTGITPTISLDAHSTQPSIVTTSEYKKYIIDTSGTYVFTVKYQRLTGGWKEEIVDVYTLIVTGLGGSSSNVISAISSYEATVGDTKSVTMSATGVFEGQAGATITDNGDKTHTFKFDTPGTYKFTFKGTNGGSTSVDFLVKAKTTTDQTTASANQKQPNDDGGDNTLYYLFLVIAGGGLIFMLLSRKKSNPKFQLHPKSQ